jgi:hypothetical protein
MLVQILEKDIQIVNLPIIGNFITLSIPVTWHQYLLNSGMFSQFHEQLAAQF